MDKDKIREDIEKKIKELEDERTEKKDELNKIDELDANSFNETMDLAERIMELEEEIQSIKNSNPDFAYELSEKLDRLPKLEEEISEIEEILEEVSKEIEELEELNKNLISKIKNKNKIKNIETRKEKLNKKIDLIERMKKNIESELDLIGSELEKNPQIMNLVFLELQNKINDIYQKSPEKEEIDVIEKYHEEIYVDQIKSFYQFVKEQPRESKKHGKYEKFDPKQNKYIEIDESDLTPEEKANSKKYAEMYNRYTEYMSKDKGHNANLKSYDTKELKELEDLKMVVIQDFQNENINFTSEMKKKLDDPQQNQKLITSFRDYINRVQKKEYDIYFDKKDFLKDIDEALEKYEKQNINKNLNGPLNDKQMNDFLNFFLETYFDHKFRTDIGKNIHGLKENHILNEQALENMQKEYDELIFYNPGETPVIENDNKNNDEKTKKIYTYQNIDPQNDRQFSREKSYNLKKGQGKSEEEIKEELDEEEKQRKEFERTSRKYKHENLSNEELTNLQKTELYQKLVQDKMNELTNRAMEEKERKDENRRQKEDIDKDDDLDV